MTQTVALQTSGRSMEPLIPAGSEVEVAPCPVEAFARGDVIVFLSPRGPVVHRVLAVEQRNGTPFFLEKGDAMLRGSWHGPVTVLGRVTAVRQPGRPETGSFPGPVVNRLLGVYGLTLHRLASLVAPRATPGEFADGAAGPRAGLVSVLYTPVRLLCRGAGRRARAGAAATPRAGNAEKDLLLRCVRDACAGAAGTRDMPDGIDWDAVLGTAAYHGLIPLLHFQLKTGGAIDRVPERVLDALRERSRAEKVKRQLLEQELLNLAADLDRAGVRFAVLKGLASGGDLYPDPYLRPVQDIDILVRPGDVEGAAGILESRAFEHALPARRRAFARRHHIHLPMVKPVPVPLFVELHWRPMDKFTLPGNGWETAWGRLGAAAVQGTPLPSLCREDMLIHTALHADKHGYLNRYLLPRRDCERLVMEEAAGNRLIWLVDIARMVQRGVDREKLAAGMEAWGVAEEVARSLALAARVTHLRETPLPGDVPPPARWKRRLFDTLIDRGVAVPAARGREPFLAHLARARKGLQVRPVRLLSVLDILLPEPGRGAQSRKRLAAAFGVMAAVTREAVHGIR